MDHEDFAKAFKASNDLIKNLQAQGDSSDGDKAADARRTRAFALYRLDRWNEL